MSAKESRVTVDRGQRTIYLIEHEAQDLKTMTMAIQDNFHGHKLSTFEDLERGREEILLQKPTIIILALDWGDHDRVEAFIKEMKLNETLRRVPMVVVGTRNLFDQFDDSIKRFGLLKVPKSIRVPKLIETVSEALTIANSMEVDELTLSAGDMLFKEGDPADYIYCLMGGRLQVFREKGGEVQIINEIVGKQMVGEMAVVDQSTRTASIKSLEDSKILRLKVGDVEAYLNDQPLWLHLMVKTLIQRIKESNERIVQLSK